MLIRKTKIRNTEAYLISLPAGAILRPAVGLDDRQLGQLAQLGFPEPVDSGDTVLPVPIGPVSRFNANGRWIVHRDEPKEERYVRTVSWRWKQWAGGGHTEEREEFRDIYRLCYPRTHVPPPSLELTYIEHGGRRLLVGPALTNEPAAHEAIAHAVNVFLEFTGECELIQDDLSQFSRIETRRVAWRLLPPGAHPWATVSAHLHSVLKRVSPNTRRVIEDRQATIMSHSPSEQYVGLGGFEDYIAYVFRKRDMVVLESIRRDNAIYVFGQEWERFAQLSKREVLLHRHQLARIVHAGDWKERLARLLKDRAAA